MADFELEIQHYFAKVVVLVTPNDVSVMKQNNSYENQTFIKVLYFQNNHANRCAHQGAVNKCSSSISPGDGWVLLDEWLVKKPVSACFP